MPSTPSSIAPLHPADKKKAGPVLRICSRCKLNKSTILAQSASYCNNCFVHSFEGKVRQGLEQSRLCTYFHRTEIDLNITGESSSSLSNISQKYSCNGRIAIGFSGGAASRVLLHLVKCRVLSDQNRRRGGKFQEIKAVDVIYVDDSEIVEESEDRVEDIRAIVEEEGGEESGLFFKHLKLHSIFDDDEGVQCTAESGESRYISATLNAVTSQKDALQQLFKSVQPDETPKGMLANARSRSEDLLNLIVTHLLRKEAIKAGASCLLTGETSTRMAIKLIESIGKGQGHKLPLEQNSIRWNGLFILKPMREVSHKEVVYYARQKNLQSLIPQEIIASQLLLPLDGASKAGLQEGSNGDKASMGRLTESLIHLLEKNVASTVSTINKTGDKLVFSNDSAAPLFSGNDEIDINASSSIAFHQVGPSVSLRSRKRQSSASTQLSELTLNSSSNGITPGGPGDRSLQGLGLGRMGSTLYFAAKKMMAYNGESACPLCQLPSQRGLHAWKRGLTIRTDSKEEGKKVKKGIVNLTEYLCYACSIILDTPEIVKEDSIMILPSYVLEGAQRRLAEVQNGDGNGFKGVYLDQGESKVEEQSCSLPLSNQADFKSNGHTKQKIGQVEMEKQLNGFLLKEEEVSPLPKERQQVDW